MADGKQSGWWVPNDLFGIHKFVNLKFTKVGGNYERPKSAQVHEIGYVEQPSRHNKMTRLWRVSDCVEPGISAMYRITLSWGEPGSLTLVTDGIYYLPLSDSKNDEWRWESTILGQDAGNIIIAEIIKKNNEIENDTETE